MRIQDDHASLGRMLIGLPACVLKRMKARLFVQVLFHLVLGEFVPRWFPRKKGNPYVVKPQKGNGLTSYETRRNGLQLKGKDVNVPTMNRFGAQRGHQFGRHILIAIGWMHIGILNKDNRKRTLFIGPSRLFRQQDPDTGNPRKKIVGSRGRTNTFKVVVPCRLSPLLDILRDIFPTRDPNIGRSRVRKVRMNDGVGSSLMIRCLDRKELPHFLLHCKRWSSPFQPLCCSL